MWQIHLVQHEPEKQLKNTRCIRFLYPVSWSVHQVRPCLWISPGFPSPFSGARWGLWLAVGGRRGVSSFLKIQRCSHRCMPRIKSRPRPSPYRTAAPSWYWNMKTSRYYWRHGRIHPPQETVLNKYSYVRAKTNTQRVSRHMSTEHLWRLSVWLRGFLLGLACIYFRSWDKT